jgi:hypothetical protein
VYELAPEAINVAACPAQIADEAVTEFIVNEGAAFTVTVIGVRLAL